ncbi:ATP-binding protein [Nocardia sp. NPDC052566]|uniref:ATP-binding protein n=1 Tax=Nocardia sp. NPDC052566 TaxID=3364330 RepID=UPI0037CA4725
MSVAVSSAFVGRTSELSALLDASAAPRIHAALVSGEAGIGKSRLVAEFVARLGAEALVVTGRCPEFGNEGVPFAPFIAVLRGLVRKLGAARLAALLPSPRPALARWLPELGAEVPSAEDDFDRLRLFGEILTVLEQLATARPVVLILEDLHWADDSSRELLTFLVANLAAQNVLLVCTFRPAGAPALRRLVAELRRNPGVAFLTPEPFTKHEVGRQLAALLGREPEPRLIGRVFERSAGNPLFVEALSGAPEDTPAELTELLLAAQSGLPPDAHTVLRVAAVAGSPVAHELLAAAADLPPAVLRDAVRQLVDHHLLRTTETGYEFRHILIRQAAYQDLLPIERSSLHARLAEILRARPNLLAAEYRSAELALHAEAAGDLPLALEASWAAAAAANNAGAQPERLRHLNRLLGLWDRVPDPQARVGADRLAVLEQLVDAAYHGTDVRHGLESADAALALVDASADPRRAARLHYQRAYLRNQAGSGGRDDLLRALELLPHDPPTLLRGEVLAELAATTLFTGHTGDAERDARAALEIAERLGAPALAARAHSYIALADTESPVATEHFARAHAAAADADPQTLITVATWESAALAHTGDYAKAIETIQQGLRAAHDSFRFAERGPILIVKWAQVLAALGRWPEALSLIEDTLTDPMPPLSTAALQLCHARILLARGDIDTALAYTDSAAQHLGDSQWTGQYRLELGALRTRLAWQQGDTRRAARILTGTLTDDEPLRHPHEAWPLLVLAAQLPELPMDPAPLATSLPWSLPVDVAHRTVFTAVTTGESVHWHEAVRCWRALHQPYEEATSLLGAAEAELAAGNRTAARTALRSAAALATELAATPLLDTVQQIAARARLAIDSRVGDTQVAAPATSGLTPRELDVLRLVARGLSNRQIAAELYISGNTAGVHVSRILTKLGVATRTEAAATAHARGLLDQA